ncbi:hypothetical protein IEQ34_023312 [Dendrobium chrysotoxum]|uniref:Uncharacterized protein n=1 Tax=Dendrobium chrysotoxum TaxID=161865 RepID=A0AAV7FV06_DENCH|nr:hypothetical protein IEQ34_023312 [Dendrobium chrysotoxum]
MRNLSIQFCWLVNWSHFLHEWVGWYYSGYGKIILFDLIKLKEKETSETEEGGERKEESDVETTSEMKETKQEQEGSTEENPSLCSEEGRIWTK